MVNRIIIALLVGAFAWLLCILGGILFAALGFPPLVAIGAFLTTYAVIIGCLVAAWYFFTGGGLSLVK